MVHFDQNLFRIHLYHRQHYRLLLFKYLGELYFESKQNYES